MSSKTGASSKQPAATFSQIARTPLIPNTVLKRHHAYCAIDSRFRAAARYLQTCWLKDHQITSAAQVEPRTDGSGFGSILSEDAAAAGQNFLSPATYNVALQEWLLCEDGASIDDERLFGNALSSMPLVFNLFAPLRNDVELATAVFRQLAPSFVHRVERIQFEHSPGRRDPRYLDDRTAFDLAVHVITPDGEPGIIYVEVKYSESLDSNPAKPRERYDTASKQVRLYRDPESPILRSLAIEQLFREHMLAQLAVDNAVTSRAMFMAIAPRLNRRVQAAFHVYQSQLLPTEGAASDRVPFVPITLEATIAAIAIARAPDLAQALWRRYCDFDRVYRLTMHEISNRSGTSSPARAPGSFQRAKRRTFTRLRNEIDGIASQDAIAQGLASDR